MAPIEGRTPSRRFLQIVALGLILGAILYFAKGRLIAMSFEQAMLTFLAFVLLSCALAIVIAAFAIDSPLPGGGVLEEVQDAGIWRSRHLLPHLDISRSPSRKWLRTVSGMAATGSIARSWR